MNEITKGKVLNAVLDSRLFRIVYLITLSLEMIAFCDKFAIILRCGVLVWGAFILAFRFIVSKRAFKVKYKWLLWSFVAVQVLTSVWNMSRDFLPNMVFAYHSMVCFFIFYGMSQEKSHEEIEKEMVFLFKYFIVFSTVTSFIGINVAVFTAQLQVGDYFLGILRNRLIGIHTNSNLLAFSNIVAIFSLDVIKDSHLRWKYNEKFFNRFWGALCFGINFLSLFLSDSNASFLFIVAYFTVRIFYNNFMNYKEFKFSEFLRGNLLMLVFSTLMISGSFFLRDVSQDIIGIVINDVHEIEEPVTDNVPLKAESETETEMESETDSEPSYDSEEKITIGRENYDVSSGRITLFKQGLKLFRVNPIIGIGRGNLVRFGDKYLENGLIFSDLHNSYLTILVCNGIVGFLLFAAFLALTAKDMCKYLFKFSCRRDSGIYSKLFAAVVAYCAYSVFEKAILSEITFMVVFFWLILGYAVSYMNNGLKEEL